MIIQLISNPCSGSYSPSLIARLTAEFIRQGAQVVQGESSPRAPLVIAPEAERLCVVGGDGTVRHVVAAWQKAQANRPHNTPPPSLIAYPGGTVNLLQLETQLPLAPEAFVARALHTGDAREHYSVTINDTLFLACASVGPDSAAVARLSEPLKRWLGKLAYVVAFLAVLWHWPRPKLRVTVDGHVLDCEAVYLAKGRYFAGPWSFAPAARLDAATLHIVSIARLTRWIYIRFMLAMMLGRAVETIPGVTLHTGSTQTTVTLDGLSAADAHLPVQGDGDIISHLPARISLNPAPVNVIR